MHLVYKAKASKTLIEPVRVGFPTHLHSLPSTFIFVSDCQAVTRWSHLMHTEKSTALLIYCAPALLPPQTTKLTPKYEAKFKVVGLFSVCYRFELTAVTLFSSALPLNITPWKSFFLFYC